MPESLDLAVLDPARVADLPPHLLPALLGRIAAEQARLAAIGTAVAGHLSADSASASGGDHLLTLEEASERLRSTPDWLRRQKRLPFRIELSAGQIRYSRAGLDRWIAGRLGK